MAFLPSLLASLHHGAIYELEGPDIRLCARSNVAPILRIYFFLEQVLQAGPNSFSFSEDTFLSE
jgi:hypothetical protein